MARLERWMQNMKAREEAKHEVTTVRMIIRDCSQGVLDELPKLRRFNYDYIYRGRDWLMSQIMEVLGVSRAEAEAVYDKWKVNAATATTKTEENQ